MNNEGIGMGLLICQNLVKMNQGTISVHSDGENKGSTFTFTLKMRLQNVEEEYKRISRYQNKSLREKLALASQ